MYARPAATGPMVHVVDDDPQILAIVRQAVTLAGMNVAVYSSGTEFLEAVSPEDAGCLVSDVRMPGMTGVELQEALAVRGVKLPVILISGNADVPTVVRAMKNRAIDVLEKPFKPAVLMERVVMALERDRQNRADAAERAVVNRKLSRLTSREIEVLDLVVAGHANKQVARKLDITEKTVEAHRGRLMKKLGLGNVVDLVRMMCERAPASEHTDYSTR